MAKEAEERAAQAERIRELRRIKRVPQPVVADAAGVSLRAYQDWEAGRVGELDNENLKRLAAYHSVTPDFIEYGEDRLRGATPDLSHARPDQLDRIEDQLAVILGVLERQVGAEVLEAVRQDMQQARNTAS